jgi:PAS domain S-box-containing protein
MTEQIPVMPIRSEQLPVLAMLLDNDVFKDTDSIGVSTYASPDIDALYRVLFSNVHDAIALVDIHSGCIVDANVAWSELYGCNREYLLTQQPLLTSFSAEPHETALLLKNLQNGLEMKRIQRRHRSISGREFIVEKSCIPFVLQQKQFAYIISRDITDKIKAEQALRTTEEQFRTLVQNTKDGIVIVDNLGILRFMNPAAQRLFRRDEQSMIGSPFGFPILSQHTTEIDIINPYGHSSVCEIGITETTWHGENAYIVLLHDITDRKKAEDETRRSEEKFRLLSEAMRDMVCLHAPDGTYLYVSPSSHDLLGYSSTEMIGKNPYDLFHPEDLQVIKQNAHIPVVEGKRDVVTEYRIRRSDDEYVWFETISHPILDEYGRVASIQTASRDITDRKTAEQRIRASLEEKEILLREVYHRVKNNLQIVSSLLHLQSEVITDEHILGILKESRNRVQSMALVHERLYQSTNLSQIDFREYVRTLTSELLYAYNASQRHIRLSAVAHDVFLTINTAIPCGLILNELITNALKYAFANRSEGTIFIEMQLLNDEREEFDAKSTLPRYRLIVADNGIGLPATIMDNLNAPPRTYTRTTLGLHLVHILSRQMNATLRVDRYSESGGTCFTIEFSE